MTHVRFTADFDYTPSLDRRTTRTYRAGFEGLVKAEAAAQAVAAGKAERVPTPARKKAD